LRKNDSNKRKNLLCCDLVLKFDRVRNVLDIGLKKIGSSSYNRFWTNFNKKI